jgi:hypothetical protein
MAEHLVRLWISSDQDPQGVDWQTWLPHGLSVEHAEVTSFPWGDVEHVVTWWITRPLTAEQWDELDNAESAVLARIVGEGNFHGMAGPVPDPTSEANPAPAPRTADASERTEQTDG